MKSYHLGIDLHKKFSYWTLLDQSREVLFQGKILTKEKETVEALSRLPVAAKDIQAAIEPVSQWGWYAEVLEHEGVEVKLVDSLKSKLIAESKLKNDKVDSRALAELLRSDFLPTAYLAPQETRELREMLRWRMFFSGWRTRAKNRIHSILWKHGLEYPHSDLFGKKGLLWLKEQTLRPVFQSELQSLLRSLEMVLEEIKSLDKEVTRRVKIDQEARILMSMPGVGPIVALTIQAEVGDFKRFPSGEKLASYSGLVSSSNSSGERLRFGNITKRGSKHLRNVMVEAACQVKPKWGTLYSFFERIKLKKGNKVARVALARKMLTVLWVMVYKNEPFRDQSCLGDSGGVKR